MTADIDAIRARLDVEYDATDGVDDSLWAACTDVRVLLAVLLAVLQAVLDLHAYTIRMGEPRCAPCDVPYPCLTRRLIEGTEP